MPVSAYLQAALFVIAAAVALLASAGTAAILTFWIYLAILVAVVVAAFIWLDRGLLRERMRPGGQRPPLGLRIFTLVLFLHWIVAGLDRGRFHWSDRVPAWLQAVALIVFAGGYALALWAMAANRFFLLGGAHPGRPRSVRRDQRAIRLRQAPRLRRRHSDHARERRRARLLARRGDARRRGLYRAITEDRVLLAGLAGYRDYSLRVRWRLLPGLW
jgi:hypothetical protein